MAGFTKWAIGPTVFWVIWAIEALFMLWWLLDDMRLSYLSVNPFVYAGWLWVILASVLYLSNFRITAFVMVGIGAAPLAIMGLYLLVILIASLSGPIRWN